MIKKPPKTMNLSRSLIKVLKKHKYFDGIEECPEAGYYKDINSDSRGLKIYLAPGGTMSYVVHGRVGKNNARYYSVGDARIMDLHDARNIAAKFRNFMREGKNPIEAYNQDKKIYTLQLFFNDYISARGIKTLHNRRGLKPKTILEYNKQFARLSPKIISKDATTITRDEIVEEHDRIEHKYTPFMSDKTMHLVLALFSNAKKRYINEAENTPAIVNNPVEVITVNNLWKVNNGQSRRIRECIDTDDMEDVLNALEYLEEYKDGVKFKYNTPPAAVVCSHLFRLLLFTGWRPEDTCGLRWQQVSNDLTDVTWNDAEAITGLKGGEEQYRLPLNSEATKVLQSIREYNYQSDYVFPANKLTTAIGQNPTLYIDALQKLVDNNKRYTCGIYRKTFQTYAESCGINATTIKRLVFHTQRVYDVQSGYIANSRESLRRQSQKVCDFILKCANRDGELLGEFIRVNPNVIARAILDSKDSDFTLSEIINNWAELGMKFDLMGR